MKLNEVFKPVFEGVVYHNIEDYSKYIENIERYFEKKSYLYRGMKATADVIAGDGNEIDRKSSAALPYINWYTDIGAEWKKYPPRNKSFICTTRANYAGRYGKVYFVIPLENQQMGICSQYDFWSSFKRINSVRDVSDAMFNIFLDVNGKAPQNVNDFAAYLRVVDKRMLAGEYEPTDNSTYSQDIGNEKTLSDYLRIYTDPALNGFKLSTEIPYGNHEVWLTGKVLFINKDFAIEQGWVQNEA